MKKNKNLTLFLIGITVTALFLRTHFHSVQTKGLNIIGDKNTFLVMNSTKQFFVWGKNEKRINLYKDTLKPMGVSTQVTYLNENKYTENLTTQIHKYSQNFITIKDELHDFLIFRDPKIETIQKWLETTQYSTPDYWVVDKSSFHKSIPLPDKAILFVGSRKPGKKLKTYAQKNKVPLINAKDTEGFWININNGKTILRTKINEQKT